MRCHNPTHIEPAPPVADRGLLVDCLVDQMTRPVIRDFGRVDVEPAAGVLHRRAQRGTVVLHLGLLRDGVPDVIGLEQDIEYKSGN